MKKPRDVGTYLPAVSITATVEASIPFYKVFPGSAISVNTPQFSRTKLKVIGDDSNRIALHVGHFNQAQLIFRFFSARAQFYNLIAFDGTVLMYRLALNKLNNSIVFQAGDESDAFLAVLIKFLVIYISTVKHIQRIICFNH